MRVQEKQEDTAEDSGGHLKDTLMRQSPEGRLVKHLTCTVMWLLHLLQQLKHQQHQTLESSRKTCVERTKNKIGDGYLIFESILFGLQVFLVS